jgi:hypothetical protein
MVHLYVRNFIMIQSLHDLKGLGFCCQCDSYYPTREMVALNVINQPTNVIVELSVIVKIRKYRRFHEGHHFISMAMKVHDTPKHDMDRFMKECTLNPKHYNKIRLIYFILELRTRVFQTIPHSHNTNCVE